MPPKPRKPQNGTTNGKSTGKSTPVAAAAADVDTEPAASPEESKEIKSASGGKPDQAAYNAEQESIKAEIDALQVKLSAVKDKIGLTSKTGPGNERRLALRAELDEIRGQQSSSKSSRGKVLDQLKALQDSTQKKVKDLQAARSKAPYKSAEEVDAQIKHLEKQVESGNLKLGDEKRALQEISSLKRSRKTVEAFKADQDAIEAARAREDELRKELDDPAAKAVSDRFNTIRAELDEIKKEGDEAYESRNKLFDERKELQAQLDVLYNRKRESSQQYREAGDRYWARVNEDRARRAEKAKAQRAAEEDAKRKEIVDRLRDEAKAPAFEAQIEDCQTLIDYFNAKAAGGSATVPAPTKLSTSKADVAGVPKLELRQVDQDANAGLVVRKKKGEEEENYFVGGKAKAKKGAKASGANTPTSSSSSALNVPLPTLSALLALSIPPPTSTSDIARTVEDLRTKKAWFEANQTRVTAENVQKAEAAVARLTGKSEPLTEVVSPPLAPGSGEKPPEPTSTPINEDLAGEGADTSSAVEAVADAPEEVAAEA